MMSFSAFIAAYLRFSVEEEQRETQAIRNTRPKRMTEAERTAYLFQTWGPLLERLSDVD